MLRRSLPSLLVLVLLGGPVYAQSGGDAELTLGREAVAQKDWISAIEHFSRATGALDPEKDREALADAYLQLGLSYLTGLDRPAQALSAFVKSAELAASPATAWIWASMAADKLGRTEEAAQYKERAMPPSVAQEEPAPPASVEIQVAEPEPAAAPEPEIPAPAPPAPPAAETQSVPAAAAEPLVPEPRPEAPPAEPDAFQHFFGKKDEPKREEPKAAEPAPANAEPKPAPDAFQHFFGGKKDGKPEEKGKEGAKAAEPAVEKKPAEKVDAFDYFFGKKKKAEEKKPQEPKAPPPGSP
jgi:hypothetical protein